MGQTNSEPRPSVETSDMFRSLFETMAQGVVYQDAGGRIIAANPAAEKILGLSRDQLMGRTSLDPRWRTIREDGSALPGDEHPSMIALRTGQPVKDVLFGIFHPAAENYRWVLVNAVPEFRPGESTPWRVYATITDVTQRRLTEQKLYESEARFRTLFSTMSEGFAFHEIICNEQGEPVDYVYLDINPAFERLTGLRKENTVGKRVRELIPNLEDDWIKIFGQVALGGEPAERESHVLELDRYYRARAYSPERGKFAVVFEEITEQKKLLRTLQEQEAQLRVLFESSQAGIILVDPTGIILTANRRMAELFGCNLQDIVGSSYPSLVLPDERHTGDERMQQLINGDIDHVALERHYLRADGSSFWGFLSGRRHEDAAGKLIALVGHITDISELKKSHQTLELYLYGLDNARDALFIVKADASFKFVNEAACKILGYSREELTRLTVFDIDPEFPRDSWQAHWQELCEKGGLQIESSHRTREGKNIPVEISIKIFEFEGEFYQLSLARDLTERKQFEEERLALERQMLHAQKLESLGVLAGGIAHDFNNLLAAIIGNAEMGRRRMNPESPALTNLERIEQAAQRAADLAKQMLAYSGKGKFVVEAIDLNLLLEEMLHMLEVSISKKVVLRFNLHRPLPSVEVDATQIRQILMNLVINASEAIGDKSGVIVVTTGCMDCDDSYLHQIWLDENLRPGLYVYLEVADTGCGMDKATLSKLFDPFFTTKFTGRGLGMAAVMGIVRGHQGAIRVYSEVGKGTTFKILLPADSRPVELFNGTPDPTDWQGDGKILLVDDEETVRGIGADMLHELGFETLTATNGRDALEKFQQHSDICLVLLDLIMPKMDGEQCFRELRKLDPQVKVVMSSGYSEQEVTQKFLGKGLAGFIQKPYKLSALRKALQTALHE